MRLLTSLSIAILSGLMLAPVVSAQNGAPIRHANAKAKLTAAVQASEARKIQSARFQAYQKSRQSAEASLSAAKNLAMLRKAPKLMAAFKAELKKRAAPAVAPAKAGQPRLDGAPGQLGKPRADGPGAKLKASKAKAAKKPLKAKPAGAPRG
ncbi:MAG: hypothetical protein ACT4PU_01950 [Planctomycetota bacterium]